MPSDSPPDAWSTSTSTGDGAWPPGFEEATYRKVTRRILPLLILCYFAAYLDRVNIGFARLQMMANLNFSETVYGLARAYFSWATSFSRSRAISSSIASGRAFGSAAS